MRKKPGNPVIPFSEVVPIRCSEHPKYNAQPGRVPRCGTCQFVYFLRWDGFRGGANAWLDYPMELRTWKGSCHRDP